MFSWSSLDRWVSGEQKTHHRETKDTATAAWDTYQVHSCSRIVVAMIYIDFAVNEPTKLIEVPADETGTFNFRVDPKNKQLFATLLCRSSEKFRGSMLRVCNSATLRKQLNNRTLPKNSSELPKVILHPEIQIKSTYCSRPRQVVFCSTDSWYLYPPLLLWGAQLLWSCLHSMPISHQTSALMFTFEKQRNVVHHCKGGTPVVVDCIYICSASQ